MEFVEHALEFFSSYLSNRRQFVSINDAISDKLTTNISIPQGSVLGPLMYLVYVGEIQNLSQNYIGQHRLLMIVPCRSLINPLLIY